MDHFSSVNTRVNILKTKTLQVRDSHLDKKVKEVLNVTKPVTYFH